MMRRPSLSTAAVWDSTSATNPLIPASWMPDSSYAAPRRGRAAQSADRWGAASSGGAAVQLRGRAVSGWSKRRTLSAPVKTALTLLSASMPSSPMLSNSIAAAASQHGTGQWEAYETRSTRKRL
jgi:hypothetical protein